MSEWISIMNEEPPQGWIICTYRYYADPKILCSGFCCHIDDEFIDAGIKRDVTHWMPLPEPPHD